MRRNKYGAMVSRRTVAHLYAVATCTRTITTLKIIKRVLTPTFRLQVLGIFHFTYLMSMIAAATEIKQQ
jgi:hypothetical protein